jgi:hypothetical protein
MFFFLELTGCSSYVEKIFFSNPGYKLKLIDEISFVLDKMYLQCFSTLTKCFSKEEEII